MLNLGVIALQTLTEAVLEVLACFDVEAEGRQSDLPGYKKVRRKE